MSDDKIRYDSHSEYEQEETDEEVTEAPPIGGIPSGNGIQGVVFPDEHPESIDADADLTKDIEDDAEYLELIHLKIRSMHDLDLERFQKLKVLTLRQNLLDSMGEIKRVSNDLEEFDVYDNRIKHISAHLNEKTNLVNLDLSFNKIRNIKNIENLVKLKNLYFVQNRIEEIKNLENFTKLVNLELGGNNISKIENLDTLESLEQLWLGKNRIPRLENLNKLANLKILSIQSNRITKISGLENLKNLEEIYLSHNGIDKIEGFENNPKLTTIDLTSNRITKIENLSHLSKLTDLWISYNKIDSFEEVENELKDLKELDTVYFEGNPLQLNNPTAYRRKLIMFLPQVNKIDATYVR